MKTLALLGCIAVAYALVAVAATVAALTVVAAAEGKPSGD